MLPSLPIPPLAPPSLPRAAAGYSRSATDDLIERLIDYYEAVWLERKRLGDKVEALEAAAAERDALDRELESARREAEDVLTKAREQAEAILAAARRERDVLEHEAERLQALAEQTRTDLLATLMSVVEQLRADLQWDEEQPAPTRETEGDASMADPVPSSADLPVRS